ncbi:4-alpha-glucanotransferase [Acidocella sp.]|uniref:4-alpha-glucanotransferase n=1 Tax=Acidocella sp. TaxID=50710 RepID=UPI00260FCF99|nr:4-alpha-glucanotransferase [Acidocella sp.]
MKSALHHLAIAAGIEVIWRDAGNAMQTVSDETLRAVLGALGSPAASPAQISESYAALRAEAGEARPLVTAASGAPVALPGSSGPYRITLESGRIMAGSTLHGRKGAYLPAIEEPGYHRLEINGRTVIIAVAPPRAFTLDDAGGGAKLWGLAVQLYALCREDSRGIGDFATLALFARHAAGHGADAIGISPVHAQFSAHVTHYSPYAASNRAALNVLYAPLQIPDEPVSDLIDWPQAATRRLGLLREAFAGFDDAAALAAFRAQAGPELERHAEFEALSGALSRDNLAAWDFHNWPQAYRNPASAAVAQFVRDHRREVDFHLWLQYLADRGLAGAQRAARDAGMKIGLITDLAVGTNPAGSHGWTRQGEVLQGLEIGAPPDLFNRAGQGWGITAFSPRGLRNNGFAAFIDMLRHALRHAGGVRIDHVMGLARLWVIPHGSAPAQGAYLRMPMADLLRLVALESQRSKAVVLGEDLGTVPPGFREKLDAAGIAGQRVLWFERQGRRFTPPRKWSRNAAAMTTTHDLPTVAGWWRGTDIGWRAKLGIAGESETKREADRAELWAAFRRSGAAAGAVPAIQDSAAVVDAACAHLGRAACTLALLPIEDALGQTEQPNLPGTLDEHPNWRRRLPADPATLFERPDVTARLAALNTARKS